MTGQQLRQRSGYRVVLLAGNSAKTIRDKNCHHAMREFDSLFPRDPREHAAGSIWQHRNHAGRA